MHGNHHARPDLFYDFIYNRGFRRIEAARRGHNRIRPFQQIHLPVFRPTANISHMDYFHFLSVENMNGIRAAPAAALIVMPAFHGFDAEGIPDQAFFCFHTGISMMISMPVAAYTEVRRHIQIPQPGYGTIFIRIHHNGIPF